MKDLEPPTDLVDRARIPELIALAERNRTLERGSPPDACAVALAVDRLLGHPRPDAGVVEDFDDDPDPIVV